MTTTETEWIRKIWHWHDRAGHGSLIELLARCYEQIEEIADSLDVPTWQEGEFGERSPAVLLEKIGNMARSQGERIQELEGATLASPAAAPSAPGPTPPRPSRPGEKPAAPGRSGTGG
jgi:hypothetical protein